MTKADWLFIDHQVVTAFHQTGNSVGIAWAWARLAAEVAVVPTKGAPRSV
jgi:hypothetical protein